MYEHAHPYAHTHTHTHTHAHSLVRTQIKGHAFSDTFTLSGFIVYVEGIISQIIKDILCYTKFNMAILFSVFKITQTIPGTDTISVGIGYICFF